MSLQTLRKQPNAVRVALRPRAHLVGAAQSRQALRSSEAWNVVPTMRIDVPSKLRDRIHARAMVFLCEGTYGSLERG